MQTVDFHSRLLLFYSELGDGNVDPRFSPAKEVRQNRQNIFASQKLNYREAIEAAQIHSDRILLLNSDNTKMWRGVNVTGVDGFITAQKDAILMIRVADCIPIVMYDPDNQVLGLLHAGWRGVVKGIHLSGVNRLVKDFQTNPKNLLVWLGPGARSCHYQSQETPDQAADPSWQAYFVKKDKVYYIDLIRYISDTLKAAGVLKSHIVDSGICTYETESLFSHQRSAEQAVPEGRFAVVAKLK